MNVYFVEFRPRDIKKTPFFWRMVLDIIGTGYYHSGMIIDNWFYELVGNDLKTPYRATPFTTFDDINAIRANPGDSIDVFKYPDEIDQPQIFVMHTWWRHKRETKVKYGYFRFLELLFYRQFQKLSAFYYKHTGKVLIFARTCAERNIMVCSCAVDECFKDSLSIELFPNIDEVLTVPGQYAQKFALNKVYTGT